MDVNSDENKLKYYNLLVTDRNNCYNDACDILEWLMEYVEESEIPEEWKKHYIMGYEKNESTIDD